MRNKSHHVADPIYGYVNFDSTEQTVIDHPFFQRLRKVKQLGLCELVYPGAVHTRFTHSIGVMHIAGRCFDALLRNVEKDNCDVKNLRRIVRLAGLLHDIGHGPFSHAFEHMLMQYVPDSDSSVRNLEKCQVKYLDDPRFCIPEAWIKTKQRTGFFNGDLEHEHYSFAIIRYIFNDLKQCSHLNGLPEDTAQSICCLLDDNFEIPPSLTLILQNIRTLLLSGTQESAAAQSDEAQRRVSEEVESLRLCIKSILSGELDSDRLDYLVRDAFHCGVKIAAVNLDFLLDSIRIEYEPEPAVKRVRTPERHSIRQFFVCIQRAGVRQFEQLLLSRKHMFDTVYGHRINDEFGKLIEWVVEEIIQVNADSKSANDTSILRGAPKTPGEFIRMTDEWLDRQVADVARNESERFSHRAELAAKLFVTRTPLQRYSEFEGELPREDVKKRINEITQIRRNAEVITTNAKELTKLVRDNSRYLTDRLRVERHAEDQPVGISSVSELLSSDIFKNQKTRINVFKSLEETAIDQELNQRFQQWLGESWSVQPTEQASPRPDGR